MHILSIKLPRFRGRATTALGAEPPGNPASAGRDGFLFAMLRLIRFHNLSGMRRYAHRNIRMPDMAQNREKMPGRPWAVIKP